MSTPRDDGGPAPVDLLSRWLESRTPGDEAPVEPAHRADRTPRTPATEPALSAVDRDLAAPEPAEAAPVEPAPVEAPVEAGPVDPRHDVARSVLAAFRTPSAPGTPVADRSSGPTDAGPRPEPDVEPDVELDLEPDVEPVPGEPVSGEPAAVSPTAAASPLLAAARRLEEQQTAADPEPTVPVADPTPARGAGTSAVPDTAPGTPIGARTRAAGTPEAPVPVRVEFTSSRTGQLTASLLILAGLLVTAGLGWVAYDTRAVPDIALAGVAAALTLVVWGARAGSAPSRVAIDRGVLEIHRGAQRSTFDLTNVQLDVEEQGRPRDRDWRFVVHRRSLGPVAVDRRMVDPTAFMAAVRRYRRDV
ncbi:hypothetical protein ACOACO_00950 [Nocardioides sp. CPCC 205120]|uniref:hypothetical protein n=1 Tax=Nocardioides sp. CPCC 205120 TaxID=3406462 RepID=UPI003B503289